MRNEMTIVGDWHDSAGPLKRTMIYLFLASTCFGLIGTARAQSPSDGKPDVTKKALITTTAPKMSPPSLGNLKRSIDASALHKLVAEFYAWRDEQYPVASSDAGLHTWDNRLTDYAAAKISARAQHIRVLLDQVRAMQTASWPK
nr:hypothetical protein [Chthoniobacterales bacterium]